MSTGSPHMNDDFFDTTDSRANDTPHENVITLIHHRLRGRYPLACALAILLAIPCAWIGFQMKKPEYKSEGLVQVNSSLGVIIEDTPENKQLNKNELEPIVQTQATLIEGRRTLDLAVENPELVKAGWPQGRAGVKLLSQKLSVSRRRGEELIRVRVSHNDRIMAQRAVNAVLDAYNKLYGERGNATKLETIRVLQDRDREITNRISQLLEEVKTISKEYGPDMLATAHLGKIKELEDLDRDIAKLELALAEAAANGPNGQPEQADAELLSEMLAQADPVLRDHRQQLDELKAEYEARTVNFGPNHRQMKQLEREVNKKQSQIDQRMAELLDQAEMGLGADPRIMLRSGQRTAAQMQAYRDNLVTLRDQVRSDAARINRSRQEIAKLNETIVAERDKLIATRLRLDSMEVESRSADNSRIQIVQRGDLPVDPDDKRPLFAMAGAMFGVGMGFAIVFAIGLFDRGFRYIDEIERDPHMAPLLGTLPDLSDRSIDRDETAALCIHHVRNMLQMKNTAKSDDALVYTITSVASGDGKTSLAMALGMSFAVAGNKTLLLDADLVGRGLTRELRLNKQPGLCQAVSTGSINGELHKSSVPNLWALPAGIEDNIDAKNLSHDSMHKIISDLRTQFSTIIIDTGPILGSLEANLVASLCDGVVLTVSRGQNHQWVEACLERLRRMGATCAGIVFNRAQARDFEHSVSAASFCSNQSMRSVAPGEKPDNGNFNKARGALVQAVIGTSQAPDWNDGSDG